MRVRDNNNTRVLKTSCIPDDDDDDRETVHRESVSPAVIIVYIRTYTGGRRDFKFNFNELLSVSDTVRPKNAYGRYCALNVLAYCTALLRPYTKYINGFRNIKRF